MSEDAPELDRAGLLGALLDHRVSLVLVGGLAAQAHGAHRATKDADVCPEWTIENLARLATALSGLDARLKIGEGSIDLLETEIDARMLRALEIGTWRTSVGDIDVLMGTPGASLTSLVGYPQLAATATELQVGELSILVASLDDAGPSPKRWSGVHGRSAKAVARSRGSNGWRTRGSTWDERGIGIRWTGRSWPETIRLGPICG